MKGAVLHQNRGHRAAALIQFGFDHGPRHGPVRVGLQLQNIGLEQDHFQKLLQADLLLGRNLGKDRLAAPGLRHQAVLGERLFDPFRVGVGFVDFIDRHDQGHLGGFGVVDGLDGLGHDPVIGRHHEDDDIRHLRPAGAHGREGLMAGRVQEDDPAVIHLDFVGSDVLGDASRFARRHVGLANRVQQRGLAVVHMPHDGDHRGPGNQVFRALFPFFNQIFDFQPGLFDLIAEIRGHQGCGLGVDGLIDGHHHP